LAFDEELHHGDLLVLLPAGLLFFLKRAACFIKKGCTYYTLYGIISDLSLSSYISYQILCKLFGLDIHLYLYSSVQVFPRMWEHEVLRGNGGGENKRKDKGKDKGKGSGGQRTEGGEVDAEVDAEGEVRVNLTFRQVQPTQSCT